MFTGLVETTGRVEHLTRRGGAVTLSVRAPFARELARGESVAVDGVCLTVVREGATTFDVEAVERTVLTTTVQFLRSGSVVNLERALKVGDRVGGHLVSGHVDGVGTVVAIERTAGRHDVRIELPRELMRHAAERGSIAIDGVSLTVAETGPSSVTVSLIPETLSATTARTYRVGARVNVETDILAKYVEAAGGWARGVHGRPGPLTDERLRELGFRGR